MTIGPDELRRAVGDACSVLSGAAGSDWSVPAGDLTWSCRATAAHTADELLAYAGQLVAEPVSGFLPFDLVVEETATPAQLVSVLRATGDLLAAVVATVPASARAWHPYGEADREAFAAMGIVETCVHTHDMAQGLGLAWSPPADTCELVLRRLFPDRPSGHPGWSSLLWCTGRTALAGLPRRETWQWHNQPPGRLPAS